MYSWCVLSEAPVASVPFTFYGRERNFPRLHLSFELEAHENAPPHVCASTRSQPMSNAIQVGPQAYTSHDFNRHLEQS